MGLKLKHSVGPERSVGLNLKHSMELKDSVGLTHSVELKDSVGLKEGCSSAKILVYREPGRMPLRKLRRLG